MWVDPNELYLDQMTVFTVFIVDKSVAILPVDIAQNPTLLQGGNRAHNLGLWQYNIF